MMEAFAALARGRRRAWSLIVTMMGDLTRDTGAAIPGAWLREALAHLDLSSEAVRTATHRLRADGWIETARDGRASTHRLTARALAETRAAAPLIYGPGPATPDRWSLVLSPTVPPGAVTLGAGLHLRAGGLGADDGLSGPDLRLPSDVADRLWPATLRADCAGLADALARADLPTAPTAAEVAALRTLVVHDWRRIVLRAPDLPDALAPPDWPGARTRIAVRAALRDLRLQGISTSTWPAGGRGRNDP